jgi:zinc transporter
MELLRRVEAHTVRPASPAGLITEFFRALNDIGERLLQQASERLSAMESKVLKRDGAGQRKDILEMRRDSIRVTRDMAYKRTAMLEFTRERPALFPAEEFDRFDRQIHRYAALGEDTQDYAERCQFLVEELRAQVEEETNRNLYTLTMFSVIFLPATLIASVWGMNVGGIPFSGSSNGFWVVAGVIAAIFTLFAIVLYLLRFRFFYAPSPHTRRSLPSPSVGRSDAPFLLLPGEYAVGHTFVEVGRTDGSLYAPEP